MCALGKKNSVVFWLILSLALVRLGDSLQCYSCPTGSSQKCEVKEECSDGLDSCLKLKHRDQTFSSCVNYALCNFDALSVNYPLPQFDFSCCQSDLCNGRSLMEKMKDLFLG
ncbi:unnamed protein product [Knipowitschia caucasica]